MLRVWSAVGYIILHQGHASNCSLIYKSKLQGSYIFPFHLSLSINYPLLIFPGIFCTKKMRWISLYHSSKCCDAILRKDGTVPAVASSGDTYE
jgi:hypothetical protein